MHIDPSMCSLLPPPSPSLPPSLPPSLTFLLPSPPSLPHLSPSLTSLPSSLTSLPPSPPSLPSSLTSLPHLPPSPPSLTSLTSLPHLPHLHPSQVAYYQRVLPAVLQWTACHHCVARLYAQQTLFRMWEECTRCHMTEVLSQLSYVEALISFMRTNG